jgi:Zn-dependent protease with chaperone function
MTRHICSRVARVTVVSVAALTFSAPLLFAQTVIKPPKNKFTPEQDVAIGREAAAEVRKQYPIIQDEQIARYLSMLGERLVAAAPPELKNPVYEFSFTPVNVKQINAFALPGGPMFVNSGMFDAAAEEGEVVGVMAHELSHVLLRHGTANETKAENPWLQLGQVAGQLGGAMVGGQMGGAIAQTSQFGLGTLLLRYSREYEKQADLMGAQIMARAGYDPRSLAHMFETIQKQAAAGGGSGPQWLSDHPDPGNRTEYIVKEASALTIAPAPDMSQFTSIKTVFAALPAPRANNRSAKANANNVVESPGGGGGGGEPIPSVGTPGQPVAPPSAQYKQISGGKVFQAAVPADWTALPSKSSIKVVPQNGLGQVNGQQVFSYGVEFGIAQPASRDLGEATAAFLNAAAQSNPNLKMAGPQQQTRISQRSAIATQLVNPSPFGGQEHIGFYTTFLVDGTLFYYLTVAQENDAAAFDDAFRRIGQSIKLTEASR